MLFLADMLFGSYDKIGEFLGEKESIIEKCTLK